MSPVRTSPFLESLVFADTPERWHVVRRQLPFFLTMLIVSGAVLILDDEVLDAGRVHAALVANVALFGLCALVPWGRLSPAWVLVVPGLDFLVVWLLRSGVDTHFSLVVGLTVFPVLWLAVSGQAPRMAVPLGTLLTMVVMWSGHRASGEEMTTEFYTDLVLIPLMMMSLGYTVQTITTRLKNQEAQLCRLLAEGARRERLLDSILDTAVVGIVAFAPDGRITLMNREQRGIHELALPEGSAEGLEADLVIYADADGTILPLPDRPGARALRGETFADQLVWIGRHPNQRVISASARPMHDEHGRAEGAVLSAQDVTDLVVALHAKDEFLAGISHELRTPLTSIRGYTELLAMTQDLPEDVRTGLEIIERNSDQLLALVEDLIGTTTVVADLHPVPTDLVEIIDQSIATAHPHAAEAGIDLQVQAPSSLPVTCDPVRMGQVLDNLLSNAIKYTPDGGPVIVRATQSQDEIRCQVIDHGMGMSVQDAQSVFDRFFRTRQARTSTIPGLGLGLTIAQAIVEQHRGTLTCRSTIGKGTTFTITLPSDTAQNTSNRTEDSRTAIPSSTASSTSAR